MSVVLLCVVIGLLWPIPVDFDGSGYFLFMHGYSCVCSLVWNLKSLAYKLLTSFLQVLRHKLVTEL